jgi:paraquat-inducible protein B
VRVVLTLALAAVAATAGCGVPHELSKQAEQVASVAAEGALLAHDAAEGDTTETFTSEHAAALRQLVEELRPSIEQRELEQVVEDVSVALEELVETPGDRTRAGMLERKLEGAAAAANELAG